MTHDPGTGTGARGDKARAAADTAREKARSAASETADKARDAAGEVRARAESEAQARVDETRTRAAGAAHRVAEALDDAASDMAEEGPARPALRRAAAGARDVADMVEDRSVGDLVDALDDVARRSPALFLGAAALAGFAVARFATARPEPHGARYAYGDRDEFDSDYAEDYPGGPAMGVPVSGEVPPAGPIPPAPRAQPFPHQPAAAPGGVTPAPDARWETP